VRITIDSHVNQQGKVKQQTKDGTQKKKGKKKKTKSLLMKLEASFFETYKRQSAEKPK
jgi:hypothetical protein